MNSQIIVVKCPECGQKMKYQAREKTKKKKKKCVYCPRTFTVS